MDSYGMQGGITSPRVAMARSARLARSGRPLQFACATALLALVVTANHASAQDEFEDIEDLDPVQAVEDEPAEGWGITDGSESTEPEATDTEEQAAPPRREAPAESSPEYVLRLQELEDRVNDLKEQIFRSKSRLVLLRERVLGTRLGGSQAVLTHVNDLGSTWRLVRVIYSLDGNQLYSSWDEDGQLDDSDQLELYNGAILPGPHNLAVEIELVGSGFGIFSYLDGYRNVTRSSTAFTAEDGKVANIRIILFEEGGINQPMEDRPAINFDVQFVDAVVSEE